ncbi:MAG: hypothetical protein P8J87_14460 [Verrucomicrobiales bacterium]|nr:hypothetical protein [Verrucomicrobiales bacterium]
MRLLITIAAILAAALPAAAAAVPLHVTPLNGASGRAATRTLVADLVTSGVFELLKSPEPRAFKITGSSTGGRIDASFSNPGSQLVFTRTYNGPGIKANAHRFADDVVQHVTGKPGIASANISFVSDKSGSRQIYLCDADGTAVRQITSDPSPCISPCLSPDGSYLTFTSFRSGYPDIDFIDLLNGSRQRIVDSAGTNAGTAIAPDGRRIALTKSLTGNPDEKYQDPHGIAEQRNGPSDEVTEWIHLKL